jgi:hypothetical protein
VTDSTPFVDWDGSARVLHVVLTGDPATRRAELRTLCWVNFNRSGEVCGVDVHDLPWDLTGAIPNFTGESIVGRTLMHDGWLWIPLSHDRGHRRHSGTAEVELHLDADGLTALTVCFLDHPAATAGSLELRVPAVPSDHEQPTRRMHDIP